MTISLFSRKTRRVLRAFLLVSSLAGVVNAQDNVGDESTVIYRADYFAEFNPITAQDMVDRIPGVGGATGSGGGFGGGAGGGNGGRGLGGGGGSEIIINGKRMAGKSNQASGHRYRTNRPLESGFLGIIEVDVTRSEINFTGNQLRNTLSAADAIEHIKRRGIECIEVFGPLVIDRQRKRATSTARGILR